MLVLGVLLCLRLGWLWLYREGFVPDTWLRFAGLLWFGCLLSLVGSWLIWRSRVYGIGAILWALWPFIVSLIYSFLRN